MRKMNKKGFTIVELVIVIAVIAILSAVLIPTFSGVVDNAKKTAAVADAKAVYQQYVSSATLYGKTAEQDLIFVDGNSYVLIVDGQVETDTVYASQEDALKAMYDNYDTTNNTYALGALGNLVEDDTNTTDINETVAVDTKLQKVTVTTIENGNG